MWRRIFLVTLVVATGSLAVLIGNLVKIQSVVCGEKSGTSNPQSNPAVSLQCAPEIVAELNRSIGQPILLFRRKDMERKIMQSDPSVKSIHLTIDVRKRTLLVSVVRRRPVVRITASSSFDLSQVIDEEGMVFENGTTQEALPTLVWEGFSTLRVGQKVPDHLVSAITLVRLLPATTEILPLVYVRANSLEVTTVEGTLVTFSLEQDPAQELAALQLVINQSRIDHTVYRSIDMRYQRPIVTK